ncbi:SRPBCC domain-containing protein [Streptomyces lonarensis]|uniref:Carbon monoxide dehydrogenase subunit G n=1 Tax=Streptomyces lonarensis TaxID=700599 RepID=A0A7X6I1D4_9ACTN|nr:SRPBCC domain-containing protein [Streptomyces lonarensis]NJQ08698.1 hypothetical protein [Streptomyces lonarensis]
MEHEIFVPFSATAVRAALAEQERVARCVPGFQVEPGDDPEALAGRLRLRIGGSTITYRGTVTLTGRGEGVDVDAVGSEARGNGTVRLRLTVVPRPVEDGSGTTLSYTGSTEATGRLAEIEPAQRETAARRLLDRFTEALVGEIGEAEPPAAEPRDDDDQRAIPGIPGPGKGDGSPTGGASASGTGSTGSSSGSSSDDGGAEDSAAEKADDGSRSEAETPATRPDGADAADEVDAADPAADEEPTRGSADSRPEDGGTAAEQAAAPADRAAETAPAAGGEAEGDADDRGTADEEPAAHSTEPAADGEADGNAADTDADKADAGAAADAPEAGDAGTGDADTTADADHQPRPAGEFSGRDPHLDGIGESEADRKAREARAAGLGADRSDDDSDDDADPLDAQPPYAPEADLARRTMIGRSAEEVDHAPPRGRYAPQPAPGDTGAARLTLKWAAPAAAIAVAGAVAIGRVFRRRR